jgi:hypothetical protein
MRKYNPSMNSMIQNFRDTAKERNISTVNYTNEELFRVIEYWTGLPTNNEEIEAVMEDLKEGNKRHENEM